MEKEHMDDEAARAEQLYPYMKPETPPEPSEDIEGQESGGSEGDDEREINAMLDAEDYEGLYNSIRSDVEAAGGTAEDLKMVDYFREQADVADPSWQKFIADAALQIRRNTRR